MVSCNSQTVSGQQDGITEAEHGLVGQLLAYLTIGSPLLDFLILLLHSPCKLLQPHLHMPRRFCARSSTDSWAERRAWPLLLHYLADATTVTASCQMLYFEACMCNTAPQQALHCSSCADSIEGTNLQQRCLLIQMLHRESKEGPGEGCPSLHKLKHTPTVSVQHSHHL